VLGRERTIDWFRQCVEHRQPPAASGQTVKLLRCCQVHVDPPMLAIETETPLLLSESYRRYLRNSAHDFFGLDGVPLRIAFRDELELRTDEDLVRHGGIMDPEALVAKAKAQAALEAGED
ncbi:MAG: ribosome-associated GTPase EngA, partial [Fibrobacterota bacterium]